MSRFREKIDDIFEALYGNKIDEACRQMWSNTYKYESNNMENDYVEYLRCMELVNLNPTIDDVVRFIIYTEYMHIGNDHFVRNNMNLAKLEEIVKELINN